jgi:hypothetical protein
MPTSQVVSPAAGADPVSSPAPEITAICTMKITFISITSSSACPSELPRR